MSVRGILLTLLTPRTAVLLNTYYRILGGMDFLSSVLKDLNSNLAAGKRPISEMMDGDRTYRMRDGSVIEIPEDQLRRVWDACDDAQRIQVRLPFYVSTDTSGETEAWKVEGRADAAVVAALLGKKIHREGYLRLYFPDLRELKRLIPDCYVVVFTP